MTNHAYFMLAFLTVLIIGFLTGCSTAPGRPVDKMSSDSARLKLSTSTEDRLDYSRLITQQRLEKENAAHELWIACIKQRGLDSFSCPN